MTKKITKTIKNVKNAKKNTKADKNATTEPTTPTVPEVQSTPETVLEVKETVAEVKSEIVTEVKSETMENPTMMNENTTTENTTTENTTTENATTENATTENATTENAGKEQEVSTIENCYKWGNNKTIWDVILSKQPNGVTLGEVFDEVKHKLISRTGSPLDKLAATVAIKSILSPRETSKEDHDCRGNPSCSGHLYFMKVIGQKLVDGVAQEILKPVLRVPAMERQQRPDSNPEATKLKEEARVLRQMIRDQNDAAKAKHAAEVAQRRADREARKVLDAEKQKTREMNKIVVGIKKEEEKSNLQKKIEALREKLAKLNGTTTEIAGETDKPAESAESAESTETTAETTATAE